MKCFTLRYLETVITGLSLPPFHVRCSKETHSVPWRTIPVPNTMISVCLSMVGTTATPHLPLVSSPLEMASITGYLLVSGAHHVSFSPFPSPLSLPLSFPSHLSLPLSFPSPLSLPLAPSLSVYTNLAHLLIWYIQYLHLN